MGRGECPAFPTSDRGAARLESGGGLPYTPRAMPLADATAAKTEAASPTGAPDVSHQINAAGTHPRGVLRWGYFIILNAISAVVAVALFVGVFYADGLDKYLRGTYEWLLAHPGVTSFIAFSPLASSLLVGWGYSQRARKRKEAAARAAKAAEAAASLKSASPAADKGAQPGRPASGEVAKGDAAELPSAAA